MNPQTLRHLRTLLACVTVGILATLPAVSASALEFGVDIGSQTLRNYTDAGLGWDSDQSLGGFGLRGEVGLNPNWRIGFGWHTTGTGGGILHGFSTKMTRDDLTLDARYRWTLTDWFVPYARVGAGPSQDTFTLDRWTTTNWTGQLQMGAGIELLVPRTAWQKDASSPIPAFGLFAEFGWQHVFGQDVNLQRTSTLEPQVAVTDLALGNLSLDGILWRAGLAVRF